MLLRPRYMYIPHYSFLKTGYLRTSTKQPCFHYYGKWGVETTTCFKQDMIDTEMRNYRYC